MHPIHVATHAANTLCWHIRRGLGRPRRHHAHFVPLAAQGLNHFFDVDGLSIFRSGAVVVEDSHDSAE